MNKRQAKKKNKLKFLQIKARRYLPLRQIGWSEIRWIKQLYKHKKEIG